MIYLTTPPRAGLEERYFALGLGAMLTPRAARKLDVVATYPVWAADNDCFAQGPRFSLDRYLGWLARMAPAAARCLFAVAPDVFGDGAATLARSLPVLPRLRALGYRAALVLQPGIPAVPWGDVDAVFLGGPDDWQGSSIAAELVREARRRGKWAHRGRVNSLRRLADTRMLGCDSADGTFLAFGGDRNLERIARWLAQLERRPALPLWG